VTRLIHKNGSLSAIGVIVGKRLRRGQTITRMEKQDVTRPGPELTICF
jgi:hypothetical protein